MLKTLTITIFKLHHICQNMFNENDEKTDSKKLPLKPKFIQKITYSAKF
jgi:hypothetical protein